jgi:hypothetical protein
MSEALEVDASAAVERCRRLVIAAFAESRVIPQLAVHDRQRQARCFYHNITPLVRFCEIGAYEPRLERWRDELAAFAETVSGFRDDAREWF